MLRRDRAGEPEGDGRGPGRPLVRGGGHHRFPVPPGGGRDDQAHDRLYGAKTGERYFKGAYVKHLDQQLAEHLQPMLAHKAVASAEPRPRRRPTATPRATEREPRAGTASSR